GRDEALVELKGVLRAPQGRKVRLGGSVSGRALVDLSTGMIASARTAVTLDTDMELLGERLRASGTLEIDLNRGLPKKGPPAPK
ncbi:MAG TPA: hypothetical protein VFA26_22085, partial [Gemmataceae bacterium]|nr:hypothetical protein [Gemmataceae bacterium]